MSYWMQVTYVRAVSTARFKIISREPGTLAKSSSEHRERKMKRIALTAAAAVIALASTLGIAQNPQRTQLEAKKQAQSREQIYGSQLMTQQERNEYRDRMRTAKSQQERDQIRAEHHARMQDRAKERGVKLPDTPPAKGAGKGGGRGYGPGAGPGREAGTGPGAAGAAGGGAR
jgi:hypothetical protein